MTRRCRRILAEVRAALSAFGLDVTCPVSEGDTKDAIGYCDFDRSGRLHIVVKPGLRGRALWRVLLHEYGHAYGLPHTPRGIMAAHAENWADTDPREPTREEQARWTHEIARAVLEKRRKQWLDSI